MIMVELEGAPNKHEEAILQQSNVLGLYCFTCLYNDKPAFKKVSGPDSKWQSKDYSERVYFHAGKHLSVLGVLNCLTICFMSFVSMLVIMFVYSLLTK